MLLQSEDAETPLLVVLGNEQVSPGTTTTSNVPETTTFYSDRREI
ncbi:hypothetical protein [Haloarcula sp. JP-L23]